MNEYVINTSQAQKNVAVMKTEELDFYYGEDQALHNVSLNFNEHQVCALIGPSGCGKSTFLRCLNRMNDLIHNTRIEGRVFFHDVDIYKSSVDPVEIRRRIGMVFQKPNPFPKSIYENITWGMKINGITGNYDDMVERCLRETGLWKEAKDKLKKSALSISGGQQQRLCIARAIAINPEVILMDEPTSALDPLSTTRIENLIETLKENYSIIIVTHNMQQAGRVADTTAFFLDGKLIETGSTQQIFFNPKDSRTEDYISGKFG